MYKFFVEDNQIENNEIKIMNDDLKHISNVLRMRIGEEILITNKNTAETYKCSIKEINKNEAVCTIIEKEENDTEPSIKVDIFQGIPKSDKMETIIQKSVELGVSKIFPVSMKNCVAKIKDDIKKQERWQKISEAAAKQSKRNIIPSIEKSVDIKYLCSKIDEYDLVLVAYENEDKKTIKDILKNNKVEKIAIVVGPEGGLTEKEVEELIKCGAKAVSLGKRILRTETAPIAMISMIIYEYDL